MSVLGVLRELVFLGWVTLCSHIGLMLSQYESLKAVDTIGNYSK